MKIQNSKFKIQNYNNQRGQALITLLFLMVIGTAVIASATLVISANLLATTTTEVGQKVYFIAQSGAEDALLKLLRKPTYTGTYTLLPVGSDPNTTVSITTSGGSSTIDSKASNSNGTIVRKVEVVTTYTAGQFTISSWKEVSN